MIDLPGDKQSGQADTYTVRYSGVLNKVTLSAEGNDNWQICRMVLNGYMFWNKGDEQGSEELYLSIGNETGMVSSVDVLPFFTSIDSALTNEEEFKSGDGCEDSPVGWTEASGYDC